MIAGLVVVEGPWDGDKAARLAKSSEMKKRSKDTSDYKQGGTSTMLPDWISTTSTWMIRF